MATKPYEITDINKKQPAVVQSLKGGNGLNGGYASGGEFSAKEVSASQVSEAAKKGEYRLAVWCQDMAQARKHAADLNQRASFNGDLMSSPWLQLPKHEEPGSPVRQMVDWKPEKPGEPKAPGSAMASSGYREGGMKTVQLSEPQKPYIIGSRVRAGAAGISTPGGHPRNKRDGSTFHLGDLAAAAKPVITAKTAAGKRQQARAQLDAARMGGFGEVPTGGASAEKARAEMASIIRRLQTLVKTRGYQENLGQKEIRKFGDDAAQGKFGPMEWHEAGKLQEELREKVEAL